MSDIILSVDGDLRPLESKLNRISSRNISLNLKDSLSQPLGRITGKVSEFEKSLEASNARVLAFGASAGSIYAVQKAFSEIVKSTIEVEKTLTDINVVLNASTSDLAKFGKSLFGIARNTGQSFAEVSKAATEFSRQGLGIEQTLKRTSDALILSRLSGLDAARSVETLTAAVNTFSRAGLTSSQVINKLANVDAAFAVSSADLAEAISRVGSTAQDVGVDFDQLIGIVTAAQQTTARGGAVIGNSFKTIFTRIQRTDTLDSLEGLGIAVRDLEGNTLPAIQILQNLSNVFYTLGDAQRASVAETVGGVFQINILRAALGDLSKQYSVYNSALNTSRGATDQAIQRNEALNQTLSALTNKTFVNLKEAAAKIGEIVIAPTLKTGMGGLNSILGEFNKPEETQGVGTKIATGILKGIGSYISGPGLAVVGMAFIKIFGGLTKFSAEALKSLIGISSQADKIAAAQQRVNTILAQNPGLIQAIISKETSLLQVENQILKIIQSQNAARAVGATISSRVAPAAAAMVIPKVSTKTKSAGYIPNFVSPTMQEKMGAYAGGYTPGVVKQTNGMYYNTAESVKQFPGADGPAIIPPKDSTAGENYRNTFKKQVGFDPYAYRGYIPNFADKERKTYTKIVDTGKQNKVGMIFPYKTNKAVDAFGTAKYGDYKVKIGFPMSGYNPANVKKPADIDLNKQLGDNIVRFTNNFAKKLFKGGAPLKPITDIKQLSNSGSFGSIAGAVFESAVGLATSSMTEGRAQNAPIDFESPNTELRKLFNNLQAASYEAKVNPRPDQRDSTAQKILNLGYVGPQTKKMLGPEYAEQSKAYDEETELNSLRRKDKLSEKEKGRFQFLIRKGKKKFSGHIPNFAPLQEAINREKDAGINPNLIRVGTSSSLLSKDNPYGLGVYNTRDEPAGLQQGVNRSRGHIPNFAEGNKITDVTPEINKLKLASEGSSKSLRNLTSTLNNNQGKMLGLGIGLSVLQGSLSQVGDQSSKLAVGLNQALGAASAFSTGIGTFGTGKGGIAATGAMLAIGGASGLSANADKTFATQMQNIEKSLEKLKESGSKLETVVGSATPALNSYADELRKTDPDPEAIAQFKKTILESAKPLEPEMQDQIRGNLDSPEKIMEILSKKQKQNAVDQNQKGLEGLVVAEQGKSRADMGLKGQAGKLLAGTGIPGLSNFGQKIMDEESKPTFQSKESIDSAASSVLEPISQTGTPEELLLVSSALIESSDSASGFFTSLEMLYQASGQSTQSLIALKEELSKNPQAMQKMISTTLKLTETQLKNAAATAKAGAATGKMVDNYKGSSKLYGAGMVDEQVQNQPIDDLSNTLSKMAMLQGVGGGGAELLRNKFKGRATLQMEKAGMGDIVPEEFRKGGQDYYSGEIKRKEDKLNELMGMAGVSEKDRKKLTDIQAKTDYDKMGANTVQELRTEAGKGVPLRSNMKSEYQVPTDEQLKNAEREKRLNAAADQAKNANETPAIPDIKRSDKPTAKPDLDIVSTLQSAGGLAMLGYSASKAVPSIARGVAGGASVLRGATALGPAIGAGGAMGAVGTVGAGAAVGYASYQGGEAFGEYIDPGAEKRTATLESIPGVKTGFKSLSSALPSFLGGGGAEGPSEEDEAKANEKFNQAKEKQFQRLQRQQAVSEAPTAEVPERQLKEAQKTSSTEKAQKNEVTNNISVSPTISIAQQAATDKNEIQKMIEQEVQKFGKKIIQIAESKAKSRENGTVEPPQSTAKLMAS